MNADGSPTCLEGNTNAPGGWTGGQVMRHRRSVGIVGYGLPNYGVKVARPDEDPPDPSAGSELNKTVGIHKLQAPVVHVPKFPGRFIRRRVQGPDARTWQVQMAKLGAVIEVDGEYGPQSQRVCLDFQRREKLVVDGVVGPETWAASFRT